MGGGVKSEKFPYLMTSCVCLGYHKLSLELNGCCLTSFVSDKQAKMRAADPIQSLIGSSSLVYNLLSLFSLSLLDMIFIILWVPLGPFCFSEMKIYEWLSDIWSCFALKMFITPCLVVIGLPWLFILALGKDGNVGIQYHHIISIISYHSIWSIYRLVSRQEIN